MERCCCGDTQCPSCGVAQGTYRLKKIEPRALGWSRGIRRFGDETGVWHLIVERPGGFPMAVAACGTRTAGQIEPLDGHVCPRCAAKVKKLGYPAVRKP